MPDYTFPADLKSYIQGNAGSAHWPFDATDNGAWEDYSGNAKHMVITGSPVFESDGVVSNFGGRGHAYCPLNQYMTTPLLDISSVAWSISMWFYMPTQTGNDFVFRASDGYMYVYQANSGFYSILNTESGAQQLTVGTATEYEDVWTHICFVVEDAGSNRVRMKTYMNGTLKGTTGDSFYLTNHYSGIQTPLNTSLAFQEYSYFQGKSLTLEEVGLLYNGGDGVQWNAAGGGGGGGGGGAMQSGAAGIGNSLTLGL